MSITLIKSSGDLYIDPETGRPEEVDGPSKVDQELADLYLSDYDVDRNWGSSFQLEQLGDVAGTLEQSRMVLYLRLQQANERMLQKQENDDTLTLEETITEFSAADVLMDVGEQAVIFFSVAEVGDDNTVEALIGHSFKATELDHVIPPPPGITSKE